jgi:hypothetical protein
VIAVERSDLNRCRAVTCEAPLVDPLALIEAFDGWPIAALEAPHGEIAVGIGEAFVIEANGPERFDSIRKQAARLFSLVGHNRGRPLRMFGGFAFEETDARFVYHSDLRRQLPPLRVPGLHGVCRQQGQPDQQTLVRPARPSPVHHPPPRRHAHPDVG